MSMLDEDVENLRYHLAKLLAMRRVQSFASPRWVYEWEIEHMRMRLDHAQMRRDRMKAELAQHE